MQLKDQMSLKSRDPIPLYYEPLWYMDLKTGGAAPAPSGEEENYRDASSQDLSEWFKV